MLRAFFIAVLVLSVVMGTASAYSTTTRKPKTTTTPKLIGISANCTQNITFCAVQLTNNGNTTSTCADLSSCQPLNATADKLMYVCGNLTGCAIESSSNNSSMEGTIIGLVVGMFLFCIIIVCTCFTCDSTD